MKDDININLIKTYIYKNALTYSEFCRRCNINYSTLTKILSNDYRFKVTALFKIARVMNIQIKEIFIQ